MGCWIYMTSKRDTSGRFGHQAFENFRLILDTLPDTVVVVTSTWRYHYTLSEMKAYFCEVGISSKRSSMRGCSMNRVSTSFDHLTRDDHKKGTGMDRKEVREHEQHDSSTVWHHEWNHAMRLYLINPSNPLVSMVNLKESRWNRYRVWKPLSLLVLAGLTPSE